MSSPPQTAPRIQSPLRLLWLERYKIGALALIGGILGAGYCLATVPEYKATTTLVIEPKEANVVDIAKVYDTSSYQREYQRTQYELLRSRELAADVMANLKLEENPVYAETVKRLNHPHGSFTTTVLGSIVKHLPGLAHALNLDAFSKESETLLDTVVKELDIEPIPNTYLINISYRSPDPRLSAQVANEVVESYLDRERQARAGITKEAAAWLTQRLGESRDALQNSEAQLQAFLEKQDLVNVGGARGLVEDEVTEQTKQLRDAQQKREQLANVYERIRRAGSNISALQEIPLIQEDTLVRDTKAAYLSAKEALDQIAPRYGAKHPKRIEAQARFDAARDAYYTQLRIRADGIRSDYELADKMATDIKSTLDRSKTRIQNLDRKDSDLKVLQREVDANRELYETFLKRYKETKATEGLLPGNVRVIDRATPPGEPTWPQPGLLTFASTLLGLMLGCALVLLREAIDNSVKNADELATLSGMPALCSLPRIDDENITAQQMARLELDDPQSIFAEGIRTLRTGLLLSDRKDRPTRTVMLCSSLPEEGKTSVSSNLAMVLAEREKVLLVDTDLRKPRLAQLFGLPPSPGIAQVLSGEADLDHAIHRHPDGQIDVLPAGTQIRNPQVLLASERFLSLIEDLSRRYDRIVFDTPPCQLVSDALLFAKHMDAVILVARAGVTNRKVVNSTALQLYGAEAHLLGAVLNGIDTRREMAGDGGYQYRYGYYG